MSFCQVHNILRNERQRCFYDRGGGKTVDTQRTRGPQIRLCICCLPERVLEQIYLSPQGCNWLQQFYIDIDADIVILYYNIVHIIYYKNIIIDDNYAVAIFILNRYNQLCESIGTIQGDQNGLYTARYGLKGCHRAVRTVSDSQKP